MENKKSPRKDYDAINRRTYRAVAWLERAETWFTAGMITSIIFAIILFALGDLSDKPNMKNLLSVFGFAVAVIWLICTFASVVHLFNRYKVEAKPKLVIPLGLFILSVAASTATFIYIWKFLLLGTLEIWGRQF